MVLKAKRISVRARVRLLKGAVWASCLAPLLFGVHRLFLGDGFGVNPIEEIEHFTGDVSLILLLTVLAVTPVRRLTGWNDLQKVRRLLGLFAFAWVSLHFLVWIGLDQFFAWRYIGEDLVKRPYIVVGFLGFLLLLPMAITSTRGWIRRLGRNWTRLHRLGYLAALLGIVHYFWITKADDTWPMRALAVWLILMAARLVPWLRTRRRPSAPRPERGGELDGEPEASLARGIAADGR